MQRIAHVGQRSANARRLSAGAQAALLALVDGALVPCRGFYCRLSEHAAPDAERFSPRSVAALERAGAALRRNPRGRTFRAKAVQLTSTGRYYADTILADRADAMVAAIVAEQTNKAQP